MMFSFILVYLLAALLDARAILPVPPSVNVFSGVNTTVTLTPPDPILSPALGVLWDPNDLAGDALWAKYVNKGSFLGCLMAMTDAEAGRAWPDPYNREPKSASSIYQGNLEREFRRWNWWEASYDSSVHCNFDETNMDSGNKIGVALRALGLSLKPREEGGDNLCYSLEHFDENAVDDLGPVPIEEQAYEADGRWWRSTGGYYRFAFNHVGGVIFAQDILAPISAAKIHWSTVPTSEITQAEMPAIRAASDAMAAYWLKNNPNPRGLKYFIANNVVNQETQLAIARVLDNKGHRDVSRWPGVRVERGSWELAALMGSPVGATAAFMLLQHKASLGIKQIAEAIIFRDDSNVEIPDVQLMFRIEDVAAGMAGDVVDANDIDILDLGHNHTTAAMRIIDDKHEVKIYTIWG